MNYSSESFNLARGDGGAGIQNIAASSLSNSAFDLMKDGSVSHAEASRVTARTSRIGPDSLYPDSSLTPGVAIPGVTEADIEKPGYAKSVRNVSAAEKAEVFKEYGITPEPGKYEVDHFISLELGGSNDIKNLWPEPYSPAPGAHEKDKVENYLHKEVVDGAMTLKQAQDAETGDWYKVYQEMPKN